MPVPIHCSCSAKIRVPDHLAGSRIQCPKCRTVLDVPGGSNEPTPAKPANGRRNGKAARAKNSATPVRDIDEILSESRYSDAEADRLRDELEADERLVWAGKTAPGFHMSVVRPMAAAGGGLVVCVVVVIAFLVISANDKFADKLIGRALLPFGVAGLLAVATLIAVPFYYRRREAYSAYAITNRRVLLWEMDPFLRTKFHSLAPEDVAGFARLGWSDEADAVGSLVFARQRVFRFGRFRASRPIGFLYVRGHVPVERLLREHLIDPYTDRLMS